MRRLFSRRQAGAATTSPQAAAKPTDDERFTEADIVTILRAGAAGTPPAELCAAEGITLKTYEGWKATYEGLSASQIRVRRRRDRTSRRTTVALAGLVVVATGGWYAFTRALPAADPAPSPVRQQAAARPAASARGAGTAHAAAGNSAVTARPAAPAPAPASGRAPAAPVAASTPAATPPAASGKATLSAAAPAAPPAKAAAAAGSLSSRPMPAAAAPAPTAAPKVDARPAPAGARPAPGTDPADAHGYSVQVAAVPSPDEARALIVELTRGGYPAYVTRTTVGGTLLYRVRVGPFESKDATKAIAQRLETDGHRGAWITLK
jgi:cell division septation protein DedD